MLVHEAPILQASTLFHSSIFFVVTIRKIRTTLRGIKFSCFIVYYLKLCACVAYPPVVFVWECSCPRRPEEGSWSWSYRPLWATMWVLGTNSRSSARPSLTDELSLQLTNIINFHCKHACFSQFLIIQLSGFKGKSWCQYIYTCIHIHI